MEEVWLRVGEVARRTGLSVRTLHHWDERGLLVPSGRSEADYRLYSPSDLERLLRIQHLKALGLSLDEVASALDSPDFDATSALEAHIEAVQSRIAAEQWLLLKLMRLRNAATSGWEEVLEAIALAERLRHPDSGVRFRAALAAPGGVDTDELAERLAGEQDPAVQEALTWALVQQGPGIVPVVVRHLTAPDADVRHRFAHVLGKLAEPATVDALAALLDDPDERVVDKAVQALGMVGGGAAAAALLAHLRDARRHDGTVRALAEVGEPAVPGLLEALGSTSPRTRARAAEALGYMGVGSAVPMLATALQDPDEHVRLDALLALGQLRGPEAEAAIAAVTTGALAPIARRLLQGGPRVQSAR